MTVATANTFAIDVWRAMPSLTRYARHLWAGDYHGAEDGMQEAVCRAIAYRHKFKGGNLAAWLNRMLRNIRCDQLAKGYGKSADRSKRPEGDARGRLLYFGEYDAIAPLNPMVNRCDPESILIAMEDHKELAVVWREPMQCVSHSTQPR